MFRPKYKPLENGLMINDIEFIADRWCCFFPDIFESKDRTLAYIKGILNSEIQVVPRRQEKVFSGSGNSKVKYTEAHIKAESINTYEEENFLKECMKIESGSIETIGKKENKPDSVKERNKMLGVILAMAIDKYDYKPKEKTNKATGTPSSKGSIAYSAKRLGINVNEGTVKKYLEQAYDLHRDEIENI